MNDGGICVTDPKTASATRLLICVLAIAAPLGCSIPIAETPGSIAEMSDAAHWDAPTIAGDVATNRPLGVEPLANEPLGNGPDAYLSNDSQTEGFSEGESAAEEANLPPQSTLFQEIETTGSGDELEDESEIVDLESEIPPHEEVYSDREAELPLEPATEGAIASDVALHSNAAAASVERLGEEQAKPTLAVADREGSTSLATDKTRGPIVAVQSLPAWSEQRTWFQNNEPQNNEVR